MDGVLSTARELGVLGNSDDVPIGTHNSGAGQRTVYLRNDAADGFSNPVDTNGVLTLLSIASNGAARNTLEVTIRRSRFPRLPASLTLDGSPAVFTPPAEGFSIQGLDPSPAGDHAHAIGLVSEADRAAAILAIPPAQAGQYAGGGVLAPPPPDAAVIDDLLDIRLKTPAGLERLVKEVAAAADERIGTPWNESAHLGNVGTPSSHRIVAVDGDCRVGPGTGYGVLLVRGTLSFAGNVEWNGTVLVIGQGAIVATGGAVRIAGGVFVARTRDGDRSPTNPLGTQLRERGDVSVDFSAIGTGGIDLDRTAEDALNRTLPYVPIAIREF
jgi:hypothetical protein